MILHFPELPSTNSYLKENFEGLPQYALIYADNQTAGRGQRGNGWESEPGRNLLMSMLYYPSASLHPSCQFLISKAVSVAVARVVSRLLDGEAAPEVCIKWPNDIYIGDRKVCGILIEHSLSSPTTIGHTVIGVGLNLNQREFRSDAPNPVSVIDFLGEEVEVGQVAQMLREELIDTLAWLDGDTAPLDAEYRSRLWRREGFHHYMSLTPSSRPAPTAVSGNALGNLPDGCFMGEIVDVSPSGPITLRLPDGRCHSFNFKEITPVIGMSSCDAHSDSTCLS